jgi:RNA polymerase sigma factor (sigma-70 family)
LSHQEHDTFMKSASVPAAAGNPGDNTRQAETAGATDLAHDPIPGLVAAALAGDQRAWDRLEERFEPLVWSICRSYRLSREDAEDVYQMTWLRLAEKLDQVRDPRALPGWITTTCKRECQAQITRGRGTVALEPEDLEYHLGGDDAGVDRVLLAAEERAALWEAFGRLGDRCQDVLRALILDVPDGERPSYQEVSRELGIPAGSLGPTRMRCLQHLRKLIEDAGI